MGEFPGHSGKNIAWDPEVIDEIGLKDEVLDLDLPSEPGPSRNLNEGASSSGSNVRSLFLGMGFSPSLVDKVLQEKGEDVGEESVDLLLEALIAYSGPQPQVSKSASSDSLEGLFDEDDQTSPPRVSTVPLKEEPDSSNGVNDEKRKSLRMMNFSSKEIEFAMRRLGENATIDELVDFIVAAQIAARFTDQDETFNLDGGMNEDASNEALFRIMDKTLHLLEMGFAEHEISTAFERYGSHVSITELAESIFAARNGEIYQIRTVKVKTEDMTRDSAAPQSSSSSIRMEEIHRGKRPKQEIPTPPSNPNPSNLNTFDSLDNRKGKKPKQEFPEDTTSCFIPSWTEEEEEPDTKDVQFTAPRNLAPNNCTGHDRVVSKPPYFFYGSVVNLSAESWSKIVQFLNVREPEFVNPQFFSALTRKEGYVHNLPTQNRTHIHPKPPMNIESAIPHTKKWWPSWDTRKQLSSISAETVGVPQLCERLGKIMKDSRGVLSPEQQRDILHQCRALNLIWVGPYKLAPIQVDHLETILGYPTNHTEVGGASLDERVQILRHCFQTDTLGYHLSALKSMFPEGVTLLSVFTGIGGAEVALHRLGVPLKAVVSVDSNEKNRKIVSKWWKSSGQTGELVHIEGVEKITTSRLGGLISKFGMFDLVICQDPCIVASSASKVMAGNAEKFPGFDFSQFCEFVRVFQRVRSMMNKKR